MKVSPDEIVIDPEFKSLIRPLTSEEYQGLEANILASKTHGPREPLVLWRKTLIDGHNRLEICQANRLPFRVIREEFASRDAAMLWIVNNQRNRRNLTDLDQVEIQEKKRHILKRMARERERSGKGTTPSEEGRENFTDPTTGDEQDRVNEQLAAEIGISRPTYDALRKVNEHGTEALTLLDQHRQDLLVRGLPEPFITYHEYRSIAKGIAKVQAARLFEQFGTRLYTVPGFHPGDEKQPVFRAFVPGILIPVRDLSGQIIALKLRKDKNSRGPRYFYLSGKGYDGAGPGAPFHVPRKISHDFAGGTVFETIRLTEGELKADICNTIDPAKIPTFSIPGVANWRVSLPIIEQLGVKTVHVAYDADWQEKKPVQQALTAFCRELAARGLSVLLETWEGSRGKGVDDALAAGAAINVQPWTDTGRPIIRIDEDEPRIVEEAIAAMARVADQNVYQRGGLLVQVIPGVKQLPGVAMADTAPRIAGLRQPRVHELLFLTADWENASGEEAKPPSWVAPRILAREHWPGVRQLNGLVASPTLRKDGTILQSPGYDASTGLFFAPSETFDEIPDKLSKDDAIAARDRLLDLITDFPFTDPVFISAWFAMVLSMVSRYAFARSAPFFLISANTRGAGKTLLADVASILATGRTAPRLSAPSTNDEFVKLATPLLLAGDELVLFDNVIRQFGYPSLDGALTGEEWEGRILGESKTVRLTPKLVWMATMNNVQIVGDLARRSILIKLNANEEYPERRSDFVHRDLLNYVRQNRHSLATDPLRLLSAYLQAGAPSSSVSLSSSLSLKLSNFGSFESWSDLIRGAIAWVDMPDPLETQGVLTEDADQDSHELRALIHGWRELDPWSHGVTASGAIKRLGEENLPLLRAALLEYFPSRSGGLPSARELGMRLNHYAGRIKDGFCFKKVSKTQGHLWYVETESDEDLRT